MTQDPSVGNLIQAWIDAHKVVDALLQVAAGCVLIVVTLIAVAGCIYWVWFVCRLLNPKNLAIFLRNPIPALQRFTGPGGVGAELASTLREAVPEFDSGTQDALRVLNEKIQVLQKAVARTEDQMAQWEDVNGNLSRTGGRDGQR